MYISKLIIEGFRNFPRTEIMFNDGVNVLIGHNNAGKTSLLKAIGLVINTEAIKRLEIEDFCKNVQLTELQAAPPKVVITMFIQQSKGEKLDSEDLVTVSGFLIKLEEPYVAQLTYTYFLPLDKAENYRKSLTEAADIDEAWQTIKHEFLRFYIHRIFGGDPALQNTADSESLAKFDYQFLNAIRDVERDMFTGRNTLLRDVLHFFMDYQVKSDTTKDDEAKNSEIKQRRKDFTTQAGELLKILHERMEGGKEEILSYAKQTGATFNNAKPDFDGTISDVEMYSALRLIIGYEALNMKIPATHNGLGYNNLIFMSLLLAKMQVNSDGSYLGSNSKVFPILVIEEPEAHLHPAMQYKFLGFLKENLTSKKVRQVFVTTHSTQITSAVSLDDIICLHNENGVISVGYPGNVFPDTRQGREAKAYVQRFLDATRSDMLFAQKIIFVEGLAEQLLIPTLARYCGQQLENHHIAIIPVGGRFFDNFLYLFDSRKPYTLPKKVVCLKDRDPERRGTLARSFSSCYPFAYEHAPADYTYREHLSEKISEYDGHINILFKGQHHPKGKTFEYELCLQNLADIIIPPSITNKDELLELIEGYHTGNSLEQLFDIVRTSEGSSAIIDALTAADDTEWSQDDKKKALIASRYLNSVSKGENALQLAGVLEANLLLPVALPVGADPATTLLQKAFNVPNYIQEAISWICR